MSRLATAVLAALALGAAGCGDDGRISAETVPTEPSATLPTTTTTPPATTETTTTAPAQTTPGSTAGGTPSPGSEDAPDEGGDEEGARVPAEFKVGSGKASPASVDVPAFLTIELRLTTTDGAPHDVTLAGTPDPINVAVAPGRVTTRRVEGLKAGDYELVVDGSRSGAVLRVGVEPGP